MGFVSLDYFQLVCFPILVMLVDKLEGIIENGTEDERTQKIKAMEDEVYKRIYFGGIEHSVRKEVSGLFSLV